MSRVTTSNIDRIKNVISGSDPFYLIVIDNYLVIIWLSEMNEHLNDSFPSSWSVSQTKDDLEKWSLRHERPVSFYDFKYLNDFYLFFPDASIPSRRISFKNIVSRRVNRTHDNTKEIVIFVKLYKKNHK